MRKWIPLLLLAGLAGQPRAQEAPEAAPTEAVLADRVASLVQEFNDAQSRYSELYRAASTAEERSAALKERPQATEFGGRFLALAAEDPSSDAACDALVWVVQRDAGRKVDALVVLEKHHLVSEKIAGACTALGRDSDPRILAFLEHVLAQNPSREAQGRACFALAQCLKRTAELIPRLAEADAARRKQYEQSLGAGTLAAIEKADPAEFQGRAEKTFERLGREFADLTWYQKRTLGEAAEGNLFELRSLAIGQTVPDIETEDIDGTSFKLSDYRGKVVMLDFWGHW
jgi:hypothetical protein